MNQLRKLIYLCFSKDSAKPGYARVFIRGNIRLKGRVTPHCAKLDKRKKFAVSTNPFLDKKAVSARIDAGKYIRNENYPPDQCESQKRKDDVKRAF
jgi:hypothetical protein